MLAWLMALPAIGGLLAWPAALWHRAAPRWISLAALTLDLLVLLHLWSGSSAPIDITGRGQWIAILQLPWIPQLGISFQLGLDGLSLLLVLLTLGLGIISVIISWTEITERTGFFHFNLLWTLSGTIGVFLALDLFLFFFTWEIMLVPMYFLIALWGHENRTYAAIKFFLFTQGSGLVMLLAILALAFVHQRETGTFTFSYFQLLGTKMQPATEMWIMLGFILAFVVKLPAVPFHTWLPDAHTQAPTAGSVILAGVLLKTGAYGLLRFVVPLFPLAASRFAPVAMLLGVIGIIYGALLAFGQNDIKRLVAYSSVSHLGFVLLGIFAWNTLALQGVVVQMLAHGISTGALFITAGALQERLHTRDMSRFGGLWANLPRLSAIGMFFAIASLGLPGLGNFIGEFLILLGTYQAHPAFAVAGTLGVITAAAYALIMVQKTFHGPPRAAAPAADLHAPHMAVMAVLIAAIIWLGLYPQPVFDVATSGLANLQAATPDGLLLADGRPP
ncbi:NADH-quinone oxidoreductase subunit M [Acidocella aquatica]|uniref:NADH-quinone oxidoreductase subunit M n=2 Tax=Acidocella aquatica TaxID=1922313 RepID=A0ABQ6A2Z8_9PROT|nr:NADH-quinone oxidoreductase subunit M [Acidocella aquatica]